MTEAAEKNWIATLVRGRSYTLGTDPATSINFQRGVDTPVTEATVKRLKEKAVDVVTIGGEVGELEERQKFRFRRAGEAAPDAGSVAPRSRARRVHA